MSSPRVIRHPSDPSQDLVNPAGVLSMAREAGTPQAEAFLEAYDAAERDVRREQPLWADGKVQGEAVLRAFKTLGHRVVLTPRTH